MKPSAKIRAAMAKLKAEQTPTYRDGVEVVELVTCGHCGGTWNDAAASRWTPTPAARCPFEYEHDYSEAPGDSPRWRQRRAAFVARSRAELERAETLWEERYGAKKTSARESKARPQSKTDARADMREWEAAAQDLDARLTFLERLLAKMIRAALVVLVVVVFVVVIFRGR